MGKKAKKDKSSSDLYKILKDIKKIVKKKEKCNESEKGENASAYTTSNLNLKGQSMTELTD